VPRLHPDTLAEHLDALYRAALLLCGDPDEAQDLAQETCVRVLARPRALRGDPRGYLMRALRNTFYSRLRTASRRPQIAAGLDDIQPVDPRAEPERAAEIAELLRAIAALPDDFRMVLVAVDVLGLSYAEAGRALGALEATITTRVYRARQRVARALEAPGDAAVQPAATAPDAAGEATAPSRSLSRGEVGQPR